MMKFIFGLVVPFLFSFVIRGQYAVLQAEHYEIKRYLKHNIKKKIVVQSLMIILLVIGLLKKSYITILFVPSIILNGTLVNKHKLICTNRIRRMWVIYYITTYLFYCIIPFNWYESIFALNNACILILNIVHLISTQIEAMILNRYIKEAKKIIKNKVVIGVTGSYGKTSSKNIIYDMLESVCNVSKTPKSYNTKVGIVKSIRENVNHCDDVFICEYGVDRKKGMNKLLKVVKPNISLITEVGPQHLLTFKKIDNIVDEKIKLATILKKDEIAVVNNDNKYLNDKVKDLNCNVITYGIEKNSKIMAKKICVNRNGSSFDLFVDNKKIKRLKIKLLGEHNILNTLGAIGVLIALKIDLKHIDKLALNIKPVEHRLELKNIDGYEVIDDSFNSNEAGFKKAIDVLNLMKEEKVVITPGIIEQGKNSDKVNFELGQYMANKIDFIILVEKNNKIIKEGLLSRGFNGEKVVVKSNFIEAWEFVKKTIDKTNKIILIENDLPSIYLK